MSDREIIGILNELGIDINKMNFSFNSLKKGIKVEMEHGKKSGLTNITDNNLEMTMKIALAHLFEFPDYYERLEEMEKNAKEHWFKQNIKIIK